MIYFITTFDGKIDIGVYPILFISAPNKATQCANKTISQKKFYIKAIISILITYTSKNIKQAQMMAIQYKNTKYKQ